MDESKITKLSFGSSSYESWISVDGSPLPIYSSTLSSDGKKMIGYIEAQDGKAFKICHRGPSLPSIAASPFVDGSRMGRTKLVFSASNPEFYEDERIGVQQSPTSIAPYTFSPLHITDDDRHVTVTDPTVVFSLGTIQLRLKRLKTASPSAPSYYILPEPKTVHEKTVKNGVCHQICASKEMAQREEKQTYTTRYYDTNDDPYRTFEFRYLSRDALVAKGFINGSSQPTSSSSETLIDANEAKQDVKPLVKHEREASPSEQTFKRPKLENGARERAKVEDGGDGSSGREEREGPSLKLVLTFDE
ncbi:hypothetical protein MNV49_006289 [Pseudohyphozyma bogoriensis]|nr:hypothetical protein MNV49_006289 [Pseudohyphozyma bogoriensis]